MIWSHAEQKVEKKIIDTDYINERAIKTTILVNRRRIDLMSVYFPTLEICRPPRRKDVQNYRETHDEQQKVHSYHWWRLQC